jgi:hypothetical protein
MPGGFFMQDFDFLFVVAQVAVAFAGFASIVVALLQVGSREHPGLESVRLTGLLFSSVTTVFFSLVPYICARLISDDESAWRISSALFFLVIGWMFVYGMVLGRRLAGTGLRAPVARWGIPLVSFAPVPLLFANALGAFGQRTAAVYEVCLLLSLCLAGSAFIPTVRSLIAAIGESGRGQSAP